MVIAAMVEVKVGLKWKVLERRSFLRSWPHRKIARTKGVAWRTGEQNTVSSSDYGGAGAGGGYGSTVSCKVMKVVPVRWLEASRADHSPVVVQSGGGVRVGKNFKNVGKSS